MPKFARYHSQLGATAACTVRLAEETSKCGRRNQEEHKTNLFIFDSWFASVKSVAELSKRGMEGVGSVKTAHRFFPAKELEETNEKLARWYTYCYARERSLLQPDTFGHRI